MPQKSDLTLDEIDNMMEICDTIRLRLDKARRTMRKAGVDTFTISGVMYAKSTLVKTLELFTKIGNSVQRVHGE